MKKALIAASLALVFACWSFAAYTYGQCQAIAASTGQQCLHGVSKAGDRFCSQHDEKATRARIEAAAIAYAMKYYKASSGTVSIERTEAVSGWTGRYCTTATFRGNRFDVITVVKDDGTVDALELVQRYYVGAR